MGGGASKYKTPKASTSDLIKMQQETIQSLKVTNREHAFRIRELTETVGEMNTELTCLREAMEGDGIVRRERAPKNTNTLQARDDEKEEPKEITEKIEGQERSEVDDEAKDEDAATKPDDEILESNTNQEEEEEPQKEENFEDMTVDDIFDDIGDMDLNDDDDDQEENHSTKEKDDE